MRIRKLCGPLIDTGTTKKPHMFYSFELDAGQAENLLRVSRSFAGYRGSFAGCWEARNRCRGVPKTAY
jgi:hypothetical protein